MWRGFQSRESSAKAATSSMLTSRSNSVWSPMRRSAAVNRRGSRMRRLVLQVVDDQREGNQLFKILQFKRLSKLFRDGGKQGDMGHRIPGGQRCGTGPLNLFV